MHTGTKNFFCVLAWKLFITVRSNTS